MLALHCSGNRTPGPSGHHGSGQGVGGPSQSPSNFTVEGVASSVSVCACLWLKGPWTQAGQIPIETTITPVDAHGSNPEQEREKPGPRGRGSEPASPVCAPQQSHMSSFVNCLMWSGSPWEATNPISRLLSPGVQFPEQTTSVFLPANYVDSKTWWATYSPWGCKESDVIGSRAREPQLLSTCATTTEGHA